MAWQWGWPKLAQVIRTLGFRRLNLTFYDAYTDICLLQRDPNNAKVQDEIKALGRQCHVVAYDSSDPESVKTAIERVLQVYPTFDILVNNAGISRRHA
jgi:2-deoxy-D-gluconate 3-dehydrogenase